MKTFMNAAGAATAALCLCACATVTRGTNTAWEVNTTPAGAVVSTSNGFHCDFTPCSLRMPRRSHFTARITKEGYKPVEVQVSNKLSAGGGAGFVGNALVGGVIGAGVDVASGTMMDLTPNPVTIALEKEEAVQAAGVQDPAIPASSGLVAPPTAPISSVAPSPPAAAAPVTPAAGVS